MARALRRYQWRAADRAFATGYGVRLAEQFAHDDTPDDILVGMWSTYTALDVSGRRAALRAIGFADWSLPHPIRYLAHGMPLGLTRRAMEVWQSYDTRTTRN